MASVAHLSAVLMPRRGPGVHRRALTRAKQAAYWLEDSDLAAIRAAEDLADRLDDLRRANEPTLGGQASSIDHWRASAVHSRFLQALEALRLTPSSKPEALTGADDDLIAELAKSMRGPDAPRED